MAADDDNVGSGGRGRRNGFSMTEALSSPSSSSLQAQVVRDFAALLSFAINISNDDDDDNNNNNETTSSGAGGGGGCGSKINFPLRDASFHLPLKIDSSVIPDDDNSTICCRVPSLELQQRECVFFPSSSMGLLEEAAASNLRQVMDITKNQLIDLPLQLLWNLSKSLQSMVDARLRLALTALQNNNASSNDDGAITTTTTIGTGSTSSTSSSSLLSLSRRMVIQTLNSAYAAGTSITPSTIVTTFRTLTNCSGERTEDGDYVIPLVVEVVVDCAILGQTTVTTLHMEAPGTIQGRFSCPSSLFDSESSSSNNNNKTTLSSSTASCTEPQPPPPQSGSSITAPAPPPRLVFAEVVIDTSALLQSMMTQAKAVVTQAIATATDLSVTTLIMQQQLGGASILQFHADALASSSDMMMMEAANANFSATDNTAVPDSDNSQKSLAASLMSSSSHDSANAVFAAAYVAAIDKTSISSGKNSSSSQQHKASYSVTPPPPPPPPAVPPPPPPPRSAVHTTTASVSGTTALRDFLAAAARAAASVQVMESAPSSPPPPQASAVQWNHSTSASRPQPINTSKNTNNSSDGGWEAFRAQQSFAELVVKVLQEKQTILQNAEGVPTTAAIMTADTVTHTHNHPTAAHQQPHLNNLRWNELKNGPFAAFLYPIDDTAGNANTSTLGDEGKPSAITADITSPEAANKTTNLSNRSSSNNNGSNSNPLYSVIMSGGGGGGLIADHSVGRLNLLSLSSSDQAVASSSSLQQQQSTLAAGATSPSTNASTWAQNFRDSPSINGLNLLSAALTSLKRDCNNDEDGDNNKEEMKQESNKTPSPDSLSKRRAFDNSASPINRLLVVKSSSSVNTSSTVSSHGGGGNDNKRLKMSPEG